LKSLTQLKDGGKIDGFHVSDYSMLFTFILMISRDVLGTSERFLRNTTLLSRQPAVVISTTWLWMRSLKHKHVLNIYGRTTSAEHRSWS
jgi:hypothetical protein